MRKQPEHHMNSTVSMSLQYEDYYGTHRYILGYRNPLSNKQLTH